HGNVLQTRGIDDDKGGTMRLGQYECLLQDGSKVDAIYANGAGHNMDGAAGHGGVIFERHRHRFEVNINYREQLEAVGLRFSGLSPDGELPEIVELEGHPWCIGVQFHPELKSKPFEPHPLFASFIAAAVDQMRLV
ncbi:MAG: CTP synthetase, partial [Alphaproteobacteria bacterium]|nr:CTP synthetase [Alphaproteobacteria bacterium]